MGRNRRPADEGLRARATRWLRAAVEERGARLVGRGAWDVAVDAGRAAGRHRITGTAAEMAFFAVLGLVPLTVAFGGALGYVGRIVGAERVAEGRDAFIIVLTTLIGPELTVDTVAPFVRTLLMQERGGLAAGGFVVALWLGSRMFAPGLHALDVAYAVDEQRRPLQQRLVGLGMAVAALLVSAVTLVVMILGPLLGTAQVVADRLGLGSAYRLAWVVGRWPVLLVLLVGFLVGFYRFGSTARPAWRTAVPGAVVGVAAWILVALGFRLYLAVGGRPGADVASEDEAIALVGASVGAVVATMLWAFLSSIAILLGGEINAALARRSAVGRDRPAAAGDPA